MPVTTTAPIARAGDQDREKTASLLGLALAQGYLPMDEYEARLQTAFAAHTVPDLRQLTADLPINTLRRADPRRTQARKATARAGMRAHLWGYLGMVAIVLTVWGAIAITSGPPYFWPIWPILGGAIGLVGHALPTRYAPCGRRPA